MTLSGHRDALPLGNASRQHGGGTPPRRRARRPPRQALHLRGRGRHTLSPAGPGDPLEPGSPGEPGLPSSPLVPGSPGIPASPWGRRPAGAGQAAHGGLSLPTRAVLFQPTATPVGDTYTLTACSGLSFVTVLTGFALREQNLGLKMGSGVDRLTKSSPVAFTYKMRWKQQEGNKNRKLATWASVVTTKPHLSGHRGKRNLRQRLAGREHHWYRAGLGDPGLRTGQEPQECRQDPRNKPRRIVLVTLELPPPE